MSQEIKTVELKSVKDLTIDELNYEIEVLKNELMSASKDLETYKNAFRRTSEECEDLKKKISSIKTIVNLL